MHPIPALLHNRPECVAGAVESAVRELRAQGYADVAVAFTDCGTYGALDEVCERLGVPRLAGAHCYDVFAGGVRLRALFAAEPGTYVLTDFLVQSFRRTVVAELGLDRHPELRDDYFGHYRRVVWLARSARRRSCAPRPRMPPPCSGCPWRRSSSGRRPGAPTGVDARRVTMTGVTSLQLAHTADLDAATLAQAGALLHDVFAGDMTPEDWEHALGGVHAIVWDGDAVIGHASVVQRRLIHGDQPLRTGYIEGVGVRADRRRQGHFATMMQALERVVRNAYDLGALGTTDDAAKLYAGRGWQVWQGSLYALTPTGIVSTAEEAGGIYVLAGSMPLDLSGDLICDWRAGDVW